MEKEFISTTEQPEISKRVVGFSTAQGSKYELDTEGRTTRYKTIEGKEYAQSGVTVYLSDKFHAYISSLVYGHSDAIARLVERRDGQLFRIKDVEDISNPEEVRLIFTDKQNEKEFVKVRDPSGDITPAIFPVSFTAEIGLHPFELGYDSENYKSVHYGNQITEIKYE